MRAREPSKTTVRNWWESFLHLSLKAGQPFYWSMGLGRDEDRVFSDYLRHAFEQKAAPMITDEGSEAFVAKALLFGESLGEDYCERLQDWVIHVHSARDTENDKSYEWVRALGQAGDNSAAAPRFIRIMLEIFGDSAELETDDIKPASTWDKRYFHRYHEEGLEPLSWLWLATVTYQIKYAWTAANNGASDAERQAAIGWAKAVAPALYITPADFDNSAGFLELPLSLQRL